MIPSEIIIINNADLIIIDGLNLEAEIEIRDKLIEMDPSNSQLYFENSNKYTMLLKQLDEVIKNLLRQFH